jgi:hypothetical protein
LAAFAGWIAISPARFSISSIRITGGEGAPEGYEDRSVIEGPSDAPGSKECIAGMEGITLYPKPTDFVFASERHGGRKPLDLAAVLKRKVRPVFVKLGVMGVGWHTVGTMLAEMGEHQLTIRDYLRQQPVGNQQIPTGCLEDKTERTSETGGSDLADGSNLADRIEEAGLDSNQAVSIFGSNGKCLVAGNRPKKEEVARPRLRLIAPKQTQILSAHFLEVVERNGGDDGTRTRGLCRDS